jgi:hypothetical protein
MERWFFGLGCGFEGGMAEVEYFVADVVNGTVRDDRFGYVRPV